MTTKNAQEFVNLAKQINEVCRGLVHHVHLGNSSALYNGAFILISREKYCIKELGYYPDDCTPVEYPNLISLLKGADFEVDSVVEYSESLLNQFDSEYHKYMVTPPDKVFKLRQSCNKLCSVLAAIYEDFNGYRLVIFSRWAMQPESKPSVLSGQKINGFKLDPCEYDERPF